RCTFDHVDVRPHGRARPQRHAPVAGVSRGRAGSARRLLQSDRRPGPLRARAAMRKTLEVCRFELAYQLRRASTAIYFLIVLGICAPLMQMMANGPRNEGAYFNAPFAVTVIVVFGS